jgi:hypothetical protein
MLETEREELEGALRQRNSKERASRESLNDQVLTQILLEKDSYIQKLEEEIN